MQLHRAATTAFLTAALVAAAPARADGGCGPLDVALVPDTTGSTVGALQNVKNGLEQILDEVDRASAGDYRLALVTFDDGVYVRASFAPANRAAVAAHVATLVSSGGGTGEPEASDEALNTIVNALSTVGRQQRGDFTTPFRAEASKLVVLVTDARPGGFDDRFTAGKDDVAAAARAAEAKAKNIKIAAVFNPTTAYPDAHPMVRQVMRNYADTTGGAFVETAPDGRGTSTAIRRIVQACGAAAALPAGWNQEGGDPMDFFNDPFFIAAARMAALGMMVIVVMASIIQRNPVAHFIRGPFRLLGDVLAHACVALKNAHLTVLAHAQHALENWRNWATIVPETERVEPSPWHGWELLSWVPSALLLPLLAGGELLTAGLGATFVLGLPLGEMPGTPVFLGLTQEALLFALALLAPTAVYGMVILESRGVGIGAARPFGNALQADRARLLWACAIGIVLSAIGLVSFSLLRSELMAGPAGQMAAIMPYVFTPAFVVTTAGALVLVAWSAVVGMAALYIIAVLALAHVLWIVRRYFVHPLHRLADMAANVTVDLWDVICKVPTHVYNFAVAGRIWTGRPVPEIAYCTFAPADTACDEVLMTEETVCYCRPKPTPVADQTQNAAADLLISAASDDVIAAGAPSHDIAVAAQDRATTDQPVQPTPDGTGVADAIASESPHGEPNLAQYRSDRRKAKELAMAAHPNGVDRPSMHAAPGDANANG